MDVIKLIETLLTVAITAGLTGFFTTLYNRKKDKAALTKLMAEGEVAIGTYLRQELAQVRKDYEESQANYRRVLSELEKERDSKVLIINELRETTKLLNQIKIEYTVIKNLYNSINK